MVVNQDIPWRNRLFAIKLYDQVLENLNEIHLSKSKLAEAMGMTRPTLNSNLAYFEEKGIIEPISNGFRINVYSLLSITDDVILQQENKTMELENKLEGRDIDINLLKEKNEKLKNDLTSAEGKLVDPIFLARLDNVI